MHLVVEPASTRCEQGRLQPAIFERTDLVPVGYAGRSPSPSVGTVGLLVRRTLPAMAATLVGFIAVRFAVVQWVRPALHQRCHQLVSSRAAGVGGETSSPRAPFSLVVNAPGFLPTCLVSSAAVAVHGGPPVDRRRLLHLGRCAPTSAMPLPSGASQISTVGAVPSLDIPPYWCHSQRGAGCLQSVHRPRPSAHYHLLFLLPAPQPLLHVPHPRRAVPPGPRRPPPPVHAVVHPPPHQPSELRRRPQCWCTGHQ